MPVVTLTRPFRGRRRKPRDADATPAPLTLVSAAYEPSASVDLGFDRAIDVAGMDPASVVVSDGDLGLQFVGTEDSFLLSPTTVRIVLTGLGEWSEPGVTMTVNSANGIVAADDGGAWAGVTNLGLPWP